MDNRVEVTPAAPAPQPEYTSSVPTKSQKVGIFRKLSDASRYACVVRGWAKNPDDARARTCAVSSAELHAEHVILELDAGLVRRGDGEKRLDRLRVVVPRALVVELLAVENLDRFLRGTP